MPAPAADDAAALLISNETETGYRKVVRGLEECVKPRLRRREERFFWKRREFQRLHHIARDFEIIREILSVSGIGDRRLILTVLSHILRREKSEERISIRIQFL